LIRSVLTALIKRKVGQAIRVVVLTISAERGDLRVGLAAILMRLTAWIKGVVNETILIIIVMVAALRQREQLQLQLKGAPTPRASIYEEKVVSRGRPAQADLILLSALQGPLMTGKLALRSGAAFTEVEGALQLTSTAKAERLYALTQMVEIDDLCRTRASTAPSSFKAPSSCISSNQRARQLHHIKVPTSDPLSSIRGAATSSIFGIVKAAIPIIIQAIGAGWGLLWIQLRVIAYSETAWIYGVICAAILIII